MRLFWFVLRSSSCRVDCSPYLSRNILEDSGCGKSNQQLHIWAALANSWGKVLRLWLGVCINTLKPGTEGSCPEEITTWGRLFAP